MRKISAKIGVTALSALALFAFSISQASAEVEEVDCDDGDSIQAALDDAEDGDVIKVEGACMENVTVRGFNITLRGLPGATITAADATKTVIRVRGIDIKIEDFDLNTGGIIGGQNGISVLRSSSAEITNNNVDDAADHGIVVNRSSFAKIKDNIVTDSKKVGIKVMKSGSADLFDNIVTGTTKTAGSGGHGIQLNLGASADLEGNTSSENEGDGLRVQNTSAVRLRITANVFKKNDGFGIKCRTNSSVDVSVAQTFGTGGDVNILGDTDKSNGCRTSGAFAF